MRRAIVLAAVILSPMAQGQSYQPSPLNPEERFKIVDLVFRSGPLGWNIENLEVEETETEVRLELAADGLFDFDRSELRPQAEGMLGQALEYLARYPGASIRIEGHTDGKGSAAYNEKLSVQRAESVREWFRSHGADRQTYEVKGWGAQKPIAPNTRPDGTDDPEGRQQNRRVEIIIRK